MNEHSLNNLHKHIDWITSELRKEWEAKYKKEEETEIKKLRKENQELREILTAHKACMKCYKKTGFFRRRKKCHCKNCQ